MLSRERLITALNHKETDRVPVDLGSTAVTGIHASTLYYLRKALGLEQRPVKVHEVFQQLGFVEEDVRKALGIDVVGIGPYKNFIGVRNEKWVDYTAPINIPALISSEFAYDIKSDGSLVAYPGGDRNAKPSLYMPSGGYFFDNIERSDITADDETDPFEDFKDCFGVFNDEEAAFLQNQSKYYYEETDYGMILNFGGAAFGDAAIIPGASIKNPKGIRRLEEWYVTHKLRPEYIHSVYQLQCDAAIKNLQILKQAVGEKIQAIFMGGTDFGTQNCELMSVDDFKEFYKPYMLKVNNWVHENTKWKTFYHSCGSIPNLLDEFVECGVDIINPVQCSAKGMDAKILKEKYNKKLVFWGGGMDTQKTLPFGTAQECKEMTKERIQIFSKDGGYIFNTVHNIQAKTPIENIVAMFKEANGG